MFHTNPTTALGALTFGVLLGTTGGCTSIATRGSAAAGRASASEDEEAGVNRITGLVREFNRALDSKSFEAAAGLLREAEGSVQGASEITRGHPDFEEVEERVARARPRLEEAIERDRIEKRNAAIADLIRRGEGLVERSRILLGELARRVPNAEDMTELADLIGSLTAIEREGTTFLDDPRYRQHAEGRDKLAQSILGRKRQAEWQHKASAALDKSVQQGFEGVATAKRGGAAPEQLTALRAAGDAFAACVTAVGDFETLAGYEPSTVVTTRFGTLPVGETKRKCLETGAKVRRQADRLAFHLRVEAIAKRVDGAIQTFNAANDAADKLATAEAAVEALTQCKAELDGAARLAGYDASLTFTTTFSSTLNAERLGRTCGDERNRLSKSLASWRWRKSFEGMRPGLATIKQRIDAASGADAGQKIQRWQQVIENLDSCLDKARALTAERGADRQYAFTTAFGSLDVEGVLDECQRRRRLAEEQLARAVEAQSIESFAANCRGDEVAVVRREGVPTQVVPVVGGRVLVYAKKGAAEKRFGFDTDGRAVDFAVTWRELVEGVVGEVGRVVAAMRPDETGSTELKAVEAALPVLEVCTEALGGVERHPGFDARRRFDTIFGKLAATDLRAACGKRRSEIVAGMPTLRWRVQLEQIRDRALEAYLQVEAAGEGLVEARLAAAGAALGSYRECTERAEALARIPHADKKITVNGPFGPVNVFGLAKACTAEIATAQAALAAAMATQKLEQFLATCKVDELEVARREGLPTRIEAVGHGRVFVYEGKGRKSKARRFAFDANGARVEEAALKR